MARPRGSGSIFKYKDSTIWWIKYYRHGKSYRESSGSKNWNDAAKLLKRRVGEIVTDNFVGPQTEKVRVEELAEDFLRDYRINERKSLYQAGLRWRVHLKPFFGDLRAVDVTSSVLARYVDERQRKGAKNATVNRELAGLKRMFSIAHQATPPKVNRVPIFPKLAERNIRKGFLEDEQYKKLASACAEVGLWLRSMVEVGRTYGWRVGELRKLKVNQVNLLDRTIRLNPGETKNNDGRTVKMTSSVYQLLSLCITGKQREDFVFTREGGRAIKDFRKAWAKACQQAGVPGLLVHDLRRTAARNLRRAGVAEGVIQKIGGWRTRSVFERYAIVTESDLADAVERLERRDGQSLGRVVPKIEGQEEQAKPN